MGMFDFGFRPPTKKQRRKEIIRENKRRGKAAEDLAMSRDSLMGYEVERSGRGHDYIRRDRDIFTGRVRKTEYVEVKSGNAKLSPLQQKTKKKKGSRYKTVREDSSFFF